MSHIHLKSLLTFFSFLVLIGTTLAFPVRINFLLKPSGSDSGPCSGSILPDLTRAECLQEPGATGWNIPGHLIYHKCHDRAALKRYREKFRGICFRRQECELQMDPPEHYQGWTPELCYKNMGRSFMGRPDGHCWTGFKFKPLTPSSALSITHSSLKRGNCYRGDSIPPSPS